MIKSLLLMVGLHHSAIKLFCHDDFRENEFSSAVNIARRLPAVKRFLFLKSAFAEMPRRHRVSSRKNFTKLFKFSKVAVAARLG
jgi:hypothetical protein